MKKEKEKRTYYKKQLMIFLNIGYNCIYISSSLYDYIIISFFQDWPFSNHQPHKSQVNFFSFFERMTSFSKDGEAINGIFHGFI